MNKCISLNNTYVTILNMIPQLDKEATPTDKIYIVEY